MPNQSFPGEANQKDALFGPHEDSLSQDHATPAAAMQRYLGQTTSSVAD